jgi:hypothetical protein
MYRAMSVCGIGARAPRAVPGAAARPGGLSGFEVFSWGGQYFVRDPRAPMASAAAIPDAARGLGRVERQPAWPRAARPAKADLLAEVWISGLFAVVFLMGWMTLA